MKNIFFTQTRSRHTNTDTLAIVWVSSFWPVDVSLRGEKLIQIGESSLHGLVAIGQVTKKDVSDLRLMPGTNGRK